MHGLLHTAKTVDEQGLHHQHGQVDAQSQQVHPEQRVQDGIHGQIHHCRAAAVDEAAGQQFFLQFFFGGLLVPQGERPAQQAGQHPGGRQQQNHGNRQHQGVFARGGKHHQRGQAHALHDHRVIEEHTVMMCVFFRVPDDHFRNRTSHSAPSFPVVSPAFFRECSSA